MKKVKRTAKVRIKKKVMNKTRKKSTKEVVCLPREVTGTPRREKMHHPKKKNILKKEKSDDTDWSNSEYMPQNHKKAELVQPERVERGCADRRHSIREAHKTH